jgi:shikimate kinase
LHQDHIDERVHGRPTRFHDEIRAFVIQRIARLKERFEFAARVLGLQKRAILVAPRTQTEDPKGRLEALYEVRDPLYRECADFVIETGRPSVNGLVNMVLMQLEMAGVAKPTAS